MHQALNSTSNTLPNIDRRISLNDADKIRRIAPRTMLLTLLLIRYQSLIDESHSMTLIRSEGLRHAPGSWWHKALAIPRVDVPSATGLITIRVREHTPSR